jgi:hypothetical protein
MTKQENETQFEHVMQILREEYARLDDAGDVEIKPALLAANTQQRLDPNGLAPTLISYCAVLEMRQMARSICRQKSPTEDVSIGSQSELFDGQLQRRYPASRNGDEVYVLREHLTLPERRSIEARMSAAARSLARHTDAFRAETETLLATGAFDLSA